MDRFQSKDPSAPIFILSLKAGGVGLNLTAANHVFHYDRWWNPAVENQATDRAFRIGQNRTVNVNKMISIGTLEERVDQMIEQKTELAERIIGVGESWVTELSTEKLRDLLSLQTLEPRGGGGIMKPTPEPRQKTRPDGPRRVRNGLKLRRKEEETEWPWPAGTWAEALLNDVPDDVMRLALEYGRLGQTTMLETRAGTGHGQRPVRTGTPVPGAHRVPPAERDRLGTRVLQRTATEAIYAAKLLAGEFPSSIVEEPFKETGHPLFPNITEVNSGLLQLSKGHALPPPGRSSRCSSSSDSRKTPELAIALRGRSAERFRNDLQEARMLATRGVSQAHTNPDIVSLAGPVRSTRKST